MKGRCRTVVTRSPRVVALRSQTPVAPTFKEIEMASIKYNQVVITTVSNGWVVTKSPGSQYPAEILAVFTSHSDLQLWLEENIDDRRGYD